MSFTNCSKNVFLLAYSHSQYLKFWLTDDFPVPVLPITLKGYPEFQSHSRRAEREY